MQRTIFDDSHLAFARMVRDLLDKEVEPYALAWEEAEAIPTSLYRAFGAAGIFGTQIPEEFGGAGESSFTYNAIVLEEIARGSVVLGPATLHHNVVIPYFLHYATPEQQRRWLPGMASGELMGAIAMTEPGGGSDLAGLRTTAVLEGDHYRLNGAKTFITGGANAGLIIVVARTGSGPDRRDGLTLLVVENGTPGFERGRKLRKLGLHAQDTVELFFTDVRVPVSNVLGEPGSAFQYLTGNLPQERLAIAVGSMAMAESILADTIAYVGDRELFGQRLSSMQNTKFVLAGLATQIEAGRCLVDRAISEHDNGTLTGADAAKVKLFATELQSRVADECLQLFGGYGYMTEYRIARRFTDARITRVYGGSSEIMKTIIAKSMGLR
ncbi:acyl-CoA dehydrogenase family protein [Micromonospora sp. DR5-3]|uniref:acyl-CoA dehydrogenase family protein n=1 Tax=unclassified Micromonospora TaxID=2617518 RepID=UPI0011D744CB|nr:MULTISPECIES: acyl-CoA dehydrogenase family protein [unclassified Micromonospora]MCW3817942.1 acyl-CoA dehydrogenase family protein [Micromonospora sp. DR5-3]TYC21398.1 acyl-CoA dehydrogenase [Micromonospora sp. MP36]